LESPEYSFEEFCQIAVTSLINENVEERMTTLIAEKVWNEFDSKDIRDVIKVSKLASSIE
jgi:hypothetical protein